MSLQEISLAQPLEQLFEEAIAYPVDFSRIAKLLAENFAKELDFQEEDPVLLQKKIIDHFERHCPLFIWEEERNSEELTLYFICHKKYDCKKFVYEMVSRWLFPGKTLTLPFFLAIDFSLLGSPYTLFQAHIKLERKSDLGMVRFNKKTLEMEISLGCSSRFHARGMLEMKGLSEDEKLAFVQEKITALIQKRPHLLDYDLYTDMQKFFIDCPALFKKARSSMHLSRMIVVNYLLRKNIELQSEASPTERHILLRAYRTSLQHPLGVQPVLGLFIAMNFFNEHEIFEKKQLFEVVHKLMPDVRILEEAFIETEGSDDRVRLFYMEIYREKPLMPQEIKYLHEELPHLMQNHIEQLVYPLFMPRNEEEVMKNAVQLSQQIRFLKDLPQIMISFDEQKEDRLIYTLILARLLLPETVPAEKIFEGEEMPFSFSLERTKKLGKVWKKYPKEIAIFRVNLPLSPYFRSDHSLDLFLARQTIFNTIQSLLGEVRDFNGGMLARERETLAELKRTCQPLGPQLEYQLENFFYSLYPVETRTIIPSSILKDFFLHFLEFMKEKKESPLAFKDDSSVSLFYADLCPKNKLRIFEEIKRLCIPRSQLLHLSGKYAESNCLGLLFWDQSKEKQNQFLSFLTFEIKMR